MDNRNFVNNAILYCLHIFFSVQNSFILMTLTFSPDLLLSSWVAIVARMSRLSKNPKASDSCLMARPALGPGPDTASVILYSSSKFVFHSCKRGDILTWFLLAVSALEAQYTTVIRPHNKHVCYTSARRPTWELQIQTSRRALTWRLLYRNRGWKPKHPCQKDNYHYFCCFVIIITPLTIYFLLENYFVMIWIFYRGPPLRDVENFVNRRHTGGLGGQNKTQNYAQLKLDWGYSD